MNAGSAQDIKPKDTIATSTFDSNFIIARIPAVIPINTSNTNAKDNKISVLGRYSCMSNTTGLLDKKDIPNWKVNRLVK
jgi:hypothetical protein